MKTAVKNYPGLYKEEYVSTRARYRILFTKNKETFQEYFHYVTPAEEKKARRDAIKRWKILRDIHPVLNKREYRDLPRRPTETKLTGIRRNVKTRQGHEYIFWSTSWTELNGKRRARSFSVQKYGEEEAKQLAIKARQDALNKIPT